MGRAYRFEFKRLDVYQVAVEHFRWTCDVVRRLPRGPFKVTDQAIGASLSVMGNIGEANGRDRKPGEVEQHYRYAQGSTIESATHLDAFSGLGVIPEEEYNVAEERLARIGMMLTRLIHKQRRRRAPTRPKIEDRPSKIENRRSTIEGRSSKIEAIENRPRKVREA